MMKEALDPPGAYGRYLYRSTPSSLEYVGSPAAFGQTTATSKPAPTSDWHSSQTRRSNGTDRFCTRMSTLRRFREFIGSLVGCLGRLVAGLVARDPAS